MTPATARIRHGWAQARSLVCSSTGRIGGAQLVGALRPRYMWSLQASSGGGEPLVVKPSAAPLMLGRRHVALDDPRLNTISRKQIEMSAAAKELLASRVGKAKSYIRTDGAEWEELSSVLVSLSNGTEICLALGHGTQGSQRADFVARRLDVAECPECDEQSHSSDQSAESLRSPLASCAPSINKKQRCDNPSSADAGEGVEEDEADEDEEEEAEEDPNLARARADAERVATEKAMRDEAGRRGLCSAFQNGGRKCKYDGKCFSRCPDHWLRFTHPCEIEKPYCPELLVGKQCYNVGNHIHNQQHSHGPLPAVMETQTANAGPAGGVVAPPVSLGLDSSALKDQLLQLLWDNKEVLFKSTHRVR